MSWVVVVAAIILAGRLGVVFGGEIGHCIGQTDRGRQWLREVRGLLDAVTADVEGLGKEARAGATLPSAKVC